MGQVLHGSATTTEADIGFCTDTLDEALSRFGKPDIFNTDPSAASPARSADLAASGDG